MNSLDFWDGTYLALLAVASTLSPKQQQKLMETWRGLAAIREKKGDTIAANFLHALAQDEFVVRPQLRLVK